MKLDDRLEKLQELGTRRTGDEAENAARTERLLDAVRAGRDSVVVGRKRLPRKWFRRKATPLDYALNIAIALCFVVGLGLVLKTPYDYYMRERTKQALLNAFETGGFIEVPVNAYEIPGEEQDAEIPTTTASTTQAPTAGETTAATEPTSEPTGYTPPTTAAYKAPTVVLQPIGILAMPRIDKPGDPILDGTTDVNLRYGIGWYPPSAPIGAEGRTVLLGHKMKYYGVYFSRLYEMQVGDDFTITTDAADYVYRVYNITSVYKDQLLNEIFAPVDGSQCMLVTCDFRTDPLGNNRFLVHAMLESTNPR